MCVIQSTAIVRRASIIRLPSPHLSIKDQFGICLVIGIKNFGAADNFFGKDQLSPVALSGACVR